MFSSDYEYLEFRSWATTGGCQILRMLTSNGGEFEIPVHWQDFKKIVNELPTQLPDYIKSEKYV